MFLHLRVMSESDGTRTYYIEITKPLAGGKVGNVLRLVWAQLPADRVPRCMHTVKSELKYSFVIKHAARFRLSFALNMQIQFLNRTVRTP